jgi:hypothetical protein
MAIPVELLFVFVLSHLLSAFLDHASHNLPSFPFMQNSGIAFPLALSHQGEGTKGAFPLGISSPLTGEGKGGGDLSIHNHIGLSS